MQSPWQKFKNLQTELQSLLKGEEFDEELVQKKMTKYIALMVEDSPEQQQQMFDHFCEFGGVELLGQLMRGDPLLAVKCYSLLFINLRNEMWTSYILCQPFLMEAISLRAPSADQEYTEYFVSFLKSLSIRINQSQVTLFYNKRNCTFPLAMAAMHYHNHPDFMVRTSVMNIVLELMKIREPKTQLYFSRFPFTSYLVAFACEVSHLVATFHGKIMEPSTLQGKHLSSYKVDLADYLYYFNDLVQFATPTTIVVIEQIVAAYVAVPIFWRLLSEQKGQRMHALLLLHECLRVIKNKNCMDIFALLLFKPQISQKALKRIREFNGLLHPDVFKKQFDPAGSYWGEYQSQLTGHCLQIFKDIKQFEVTYEQKQHEMNDKFLQQVGTISKFIRYDLLKNEVIGMQLQQQLIDSSDAVHNPFRVLLLQLLSSIFPQQHIISTTLLLNTLHNPSISPEVLQACELKTIGYPNVEENQKSKTYLNSKLMQQIKYTLINSIKEVDWENIRIVTMSNTLRLLQKLMVQCEEIEFEEDLLRNYREVTGRLREHVKSENMLLLVDKFAMHHYLIKKEADKNPCELSIPYSPVFLPQERWDEVYQNYSLPVKPNQRIIHLIQHFFVFRSFVTTYFSKFYDAQYPSFEQEYALTFHQTIKRWKKGEYYRINNRQLTSCLIEGQDRKHKKAMIIDDQFCFVLAELAQKLGCKILVNQSWKNMSFQISKEDATWIQVVLGEGKSCERYKLIFDDQVRSGATLVRLNDTKWYCYQFELSFIGKFLKAAAQE